MSFTRLLGLPNVHVNNPDLVYQAIQWHESGLDFADALHLATSQQHSSFLTFDNKFIRKAKGLSICSVKRP
jgi:predicted nucleic acid-binding protein